jgi:replicative DNA helicase
MPRLIPAPLASHLAPIPQLSDLRQSGSMKQDADLVLLIYHGDVYEPHERPYTELIIAKQRNGPTRTVYLTFDRNFVRFEPLAEEYRPRDERRERHG